MIKPVHLFSFVMLFREKKIHCLGVGGVGLSGLAAILGSMGNIVSGCDEKLSPFMESWLKDRGVATFCEHDACHIDELKPDVVVRSPAVHDSCSELCRAKELGIPVMRRGEALAEVVNSLCGVAVCGAHGKTTTSSFVATLLSALGEDGLGWCIGGYTSGMGGTSRPPKGDAPFVVEADESDGTLSLYRPKVTVLTSIDFDHMEHFASFSDLKDCFSSAIEGTERCVIYCHDNEAACEVAASHLGSVSYGFGEGAFYRAQNVELRADGSEFDFYVGGVKEGRLFLGVPGRHNILNCLGAMGAVLALGFTLDDVMGAVSALTELPMRRFEVHKTKIGVDVISDYSHHPTEISSLVATAKLRAQGRLFAVFQPHRYTRTKALKSEFPLSFGGVDALYLLPVYSASEDPISGGSEFDLYAEFRAQADNDTSVPIPKLVQSIEAMGDFLKSPLSPLRSGDLLLVVGAGDIVKLVSELETIDKPEKDVADGERVFPKVSYGFDALADSFVSVKDELELVKAMQSKDARVIGSGTNLLVREIGVRGSLVSLDGSEITLFDDGRTVEVMGGCPGAKFLAFLRDKGLSGLEFMAGIPGSIGGWLAMNAGTRHGEVSNALVSVKTFTKEGKRVVLEKGECGFSYRNGGKLKGLVVFSARFVFERKAPPDIARKMDEFRGMRFNFSGLRTAGSVFKNLDGISAGRLLEDAGCKGLRVGGAYVTTEHANIIATEKCALPSDVIALMGIMKQRVFDKHGICLEREVELW